MRPVEIAQATRIIPAPAKEIFELLARPAQHALIDGSGTVQDVQDRTPQRLSAGAKFGMQMHWGLPYKILNEVVEFDEGRRIAWRHFGGHVWRYLLAPVDATSTRVTEQFDPTGARSPLFLKLIGANQRNQRSINQTLERLEDWARGKTPKM
ncbi:MAG: SRPBCC family protein [Propionibacteriaceae bacterium]|nr:SRPBCC family protein [Propionibacteriaceae bacterium]